MTRVLPYFGHADTRALHEVAAIVRAGGVAAVPTESSYGLGVSPFDHGAVERLCRLKGRSDGKPILVLVADASHLDRLAQEVSPAARALMKEFWPGPLTIVLSAVASLPLALTAGTGSVGVRWTAYAPLVELLRIAGPLTGTSANRAGGPPAQTAHEVRACFGDEIDVVLDGGTTPGGTPSTVVDARGSVTVIRDGPITREALHVAFPQRGVK